jgi:hypothetical protein
MKPRVNPFRSSQIDNLPYRFCGDSEGELLERLQTLRRRAAIVGPNGSGKTTLLEHIATRLYHLQPLYISLHSDRIALPSLPAILPSHAVLVDGADLLNKPAWLMLRWQCRNAAALVITSHRAGLLPTLCECRTTSALLRDLIASLIDPFSIDADALFARHQGNLRNAFRELYDTCALQTAGVPARPLSFSIPTKLQSL